MQENEIVKSRLLSSRIEEISAQERIVDDLKYLSLGARNLRQFCEQELGYTPTDARSILMKLGLIVTSVDLTSVDPETNERIQKLRTWRMLKAKSEGVLAYRILSNRVLMTLAAQRVHSRDELLKLKGVGPKKAEVYGDELLSMLS